MGRRSAYRRRGILVIVADLAARCRLMIAVCVGSLLVAGGMVSAADPLPFPVDGILPKVETGALRFLEEHPEHDGRGVVVAIFDTGVDPGAEGLQRTSDGRPKIVDMVDASGSGDVDTSTIAHTKQGRLEGLSGRSLAVGADWKNPSGDYRLGVVRAYNVFPDRLVSRLKQHRRKAWDEAQRATVAQLRGELVDWNATHSKPNREESKDREELEERIAQIEKLQAGYDDPGPVFDCVVFHDGDAWRAVVDTDEDGDLAEEKLLTNFRLERQFATFTNDDLLNFAVNIYDDGNLLSLVIDCGTHGTHVAGIVAANYPDQPELNGIAPGAQIVSVKIGDTRLGSSSAGTGPVRGLIAVLENDCDLINMSYGGSTAEPNIGRIVELYSEIVNEHDVIFVASAGNNGPALSTVGSPGGTTSALIGVGAYVSPEMMAAQYALRERLDEMPYTWSSRGPTFDGDWGVDLSAPGGAIAPVPNWSLERNQAKNGTSMSSPNACGNIALLLSALKADNIAYSPYSIRRALENTARKDGGNDRLAFGSGALQIDAAHDYAKQFADALGETLRFDVELPDRDDARGVYLRDLEETEHPTETEVRVIPRFAESTDNRDKVDFNLRVRLESTADWVKAPGHLLLGSGGRSFDLEVDPTRLGEGAHVAEVRGYDVMRPDRGPVFHVPVTVVRPRRLDASAQPVWRERLSFEPGQIHRRFLAIPAGATWADMTLRVTNEYGPRTIVLHAVQKLPGRSYSSAESREYVRVEGPSEEVRSFRVTGGHTLELCLAQYWSSLGATDVECELSLHGLVPDSDAIQLDGSRLSHRVEVVAPLGKEPIAPSATLDAWRQVVLPADAVLRPADSVRDQLPDDRQIYELILRYPIQMSESGKVTPRPALSLESGASGWWESKLWMIHDAAKRRVATGTGPEGVALAKGKYTLRFHVRHDQAEQLEMLKRMPLLLDRALSKSINVGIFATGHDAAVRGRRFPSRTLHPGERAVMYLAPPGGDALPKGATTGDSLVGRIRFGKEDDSLTGAGRMPGGYPLVCTVVPVGDSPSKSDSAGRSDGGSSEGDEPDPLNKLAEDVLELQVARLAKLHGEKDRESYDRLAGRILRQHPKHLPVLVDQLHRLDNDDRKERLPEIVEAADRVIDEIDEDRLASHYGRNLDTDDPAQQEERKEMDLQRKTLSDALYRKGRALGYMDLPPEPPDADPDSLAATRRVPMGTSPHFPTAKKPEYGRFSKPDVREQAFEENYARLARWVDMSDPEFVLLNIRRERRHGRYAGALELLLARMKGAEPDRLLAKKKADLLAELGWDHWAAYERAWMVIRFPKDFAPF